MIEIIQMAGVCGLLILGIYVIYKIGVKEGKYQEKIHLLDVLQSIKSEEMTATTRYHILYVMNGILEKLRKEWGV